MKTAYLLAFVDVRKTPPVVAGAGIYSDSETGITIDIGKFCPVRVGFACRDTFDAAKRELEQQIARSSAWAWVRPLLGKAGS